MNGLAGSWQRAESSKRNSSSCLLPATCCLLLLFGCGGKPNAVNIQLRKENQSLQNDLAEANRQRQADHETLQGYERKNAILPAIPQERLDKLFTANDLALGRATGGHQSDGSSFDDGVYVYAVPTDEQGEPIKAAGSFKVELFDLKEPTHPLIGTWAFDVNQTRKLFYAHFSLYTYVLPCPWQTVPIHRDLTVHVTFDDELTGRELIAQREVKVNPPLSSATIPTAAP
jgi:hypothetical protein